MVVKNTSSTDAQIRSQQRCQLHQAGLIDYEVAWQWQRSLVEQRRSNFELEDLLILLEHPPVYTLGQGASWKFVKFDSPQLAAKVCRVERGGEVTYHCPGQLVGYPILNLRRYQLDLHWYLRQLEEVVIRSIAPFGLVGERLSGLTGVWVEGYKVAAIGIKVSRWITMHGFAINVCPDLTGFGAIVPCGISDRPVGSLAQFGAIEVADVQQQVIRAFSEVFEVQLVESSPVTKHCL